jgi:F-type H+-transporting ATPase subunit epsilon
MTLSVEIRVPNGVVLQREIAALQARDASGSFGLLPGHEDFCTVLVPCVVGIRDQEGRESYAAVDGGILLLERGHLAIVTQDAVTADRLEDVATAAAAMVQERRGQELAARAAFADMVASLLQELTALEPR